MESTTTNMSVAEIASFQEVTSTSQQTLVSEGGMDVLNQDIQPSVMLAPEVAEQMETDLPFETLRPQDEATEALKDLQLRDSEVEMEGIQEGEDKDVQAIDEYLKEPLQVVSPMVKTTPSSEEGVEVIPPLVTPIETVVANTPSSEEGVEVIPPPVTPIETEVAPTSTPTIEEEEELFQLPAT